jgi:hypothetical protein
MKTVVLLCGSNCVGKTMTLKVFFGVKHIRKLKPMQLLENHLNGKTVYAVSLSSPHELANDFCNVKKVEERVDKRLKKCDEKAQGKDYFLIIPFTMSVEDGEINEKCILEPIEWLRVMNIRVTAVYLRKTETDLLDAKDALMEKIAAPRIISKIDEEDRQARELEEIIKKL